ncbi:MAG: hypothetical protein ACTJHW_14885 [Paenalcaligenes sp.]
MNLFLNAVMLVVALLIPFPAFASNGLLTLVVGIPVLIVAAIVLAILLAMRSRPSIKTLAAILFLPTLAYSLYVALDAITMLSDIGTENFSIGLAFFALLTLACILFFLIVRRRPTTP